MSEVNTHENKPIEAGTTSIKVIPDLKTMRRFLNDIIEVFDRYDFPDEAPERHDSQTGS